MRSHKHVTCQSDVAQMFYNLCLEVQKAYRKEVVANGMKEDFFIKYFISSRKYIDCDRAQCKNAHRANLLALQELFENRLDLVNKYLLAESFSYEDCLQLASELGTHDSSTPSSPANSTLDHRLSDEQMACIAKCAEKNNLFNFTPTMEIVKAFSIAKWASRCA